MPSKPSDIPRQVLIAEDGKATAMLLKELVGQWGYEGLVVYNGIDALAALKSPDGPRLAILDWEMPGLDGPEVCRAVRELTRRYVYLILLTAKTNLSDTVIGLDAGADDFINKPFDESELRCRLRAGQRIVDLEAGLEQKVRELEKALAQVDTLEGMIPICMHCKRVRDTGQLWTQVERYIEQHSTARFSHGICEECLATHYPEVAARPADPELGKRKRSG